MKKIIVTGGLGFIGYNLINKLLEVYKEDVEILNIDNGPTGYKFKGHKHLSPLFDGYSVDLSTINLKKLLDKEEIFFCFHLAAVARIRPSFKRPKLYLKNNIDSTINIVDYCASRNIPILYAGSSSQLYKDSVNPYTFSKEVCEDIIKMYYKVNGLNYTVAYFYNVYGDFQSEEKEYATLIGEWIRCIKNKEDCFIYGDGEKRRDFTNVSDVVNGLIKIMEYQTSSIFDKEEDREFHLGYGKNYSINDIAQAFRISPVYLNEIAGETKETLNITKNNLIDFEYKVDVIDWIRNFVLSKQVPPADRVIREGKDPILNLKR